MLFLSKTSNAETGTSPLIEGDEFLLHPAFKQVEPARIQTSESWPWPFCDVDPTSSNDVRKSYPISTGSRRILAPPNQHRCGARNKAGLGTYKGI